MFARHSVDSGQTLEKTAPKCLTQNFGWYVNQPCSIAYRCAGNNSGGPGDFFIQLTSAEANET